MRILQLCKKFPYPLKDGEAIAVSNLSKALSNAGCEITLLAMNTRKHHFDVKTLPKDYNQYRQIHHTELDNRISVFGAVKNLITGQSYHVSRYISNEFSRKLESILQENQFDIIQLETLYLAPYIQLIRNYSNAKIVLRAHNVEHEIWDRIGRNIQNPIKKAYVKYLSRKLKTYEKAAINSCDLLIPISERDDRKFRQMGYKGPSTVIPIGLDMNSYRPDYHSYTRPLSMGFIGSLDWMPNLEGLKWFLDEIWPTIKERFPSMTLQIAGRNTPPWLFQRRDPDIFVLGEVDEARDFLNQHSITLVPLLSGSGMRAKILEAMALGRVVMTTSMGMEGIFATHKKDIICADSPEEYVDGLEFCLRNNGGLTQVGKRARAFVESHYAHTEIAKSLIRAYDSFETETTRSNVILEKVVSDK